MSIKAWSWKPDYDEERMKKRRQTQAQKTWDWVEHTSYQTAQNLGGFIM